MARLDRSPAGLSYPGGHDASGFPRARSWAVGCCLLPTAMIPAPYDLLSIRANCYSARAFREGFGSFLRINRTYGGVEVPVGDTKILAGNRVGDCAVLLVDDAPGVRVDQSAVSLGDQSGGRVDGFSR